MEQGQPLVNEYTLPFPLNWDKSTVNSSTAELFSWMFEAFLYYTSELRNKHCTYVDKITMTSIEHIQKII